MWCGRDIEMTCIELPVVLWHHARPIRDRIMQQCMHTHELDYYAASALPLCSISIRVLCCPFQHWQCMHRTTKIALEALGVGRFRGQQSWSRYCLHVRKWRVNDCWLQVGAELLGWVSNWVVG